MRTRIEVNAANKKDLSNILSSYGLDEAINRGEIECSFCTDAITWDSLGGFLIKNGQPILFCNMPDCLESAAKGIENE